MHISFAWCAKSKEHTREISSLKWETVPQIFLFCLGGRYKCCSVFGTCAIVCEVSASMYVRRAYTNFPLLNVRRPQWRQQQQQLTASSQSRVRRDNKACLVKTHPPNAIRTHTCSLFRCYSSSIRSIVVSLGCVETCVRVRRTIFEIGRLTVCARARELLCSVYSLSMPMSVC